MKELSQFHDLRLTALVARRVANDRGEHTQLLLLACELARHPAKLDGPQHHRRSFSLLKNQEPEVIRRAAVEVGGGSGADGLATA
jgi:hypothetical protein